MQKLKPKFPQIAYTCTKLMERLMERWIRWVEMLLTLPEILYAIYDRQKKRLPLTAAQSERLFLFLPLLQFPLIAIENSSLSILFLMLLLFYTPKKSAPFIEQTLLLSIGANYPIYAPFVALWLIASFLLTHTPLSPSFAPPLNRFLWLTAVILYLPLIKILAPLLLAATLVLQSERKLSTIPITETDSV